MPQKFFRHATFALLLMLTVHTAVVVSAETHQVTVQAGEHDREDAIVSIELPTTLQGEAPLRVIRQDDGRTIISQRDGNKHLVFRLKAPLRANRERVFRIEPATPESAALADAIQVVKKEKTIEVNSARKPTFTYHIAKTTPPEGIDSIYSSSGYIHPLRTPLGRVVTDAYPPDHAHQHALFASWPRTMIEGERIDFWNQHKKLGFTGHHEVVEDSIINGPLFGEFTVVRKYVSTISDSKEPTICMLETWRVRTWQHPRGTVVDVHSKLTATTRKVEFPAYHYGGMAIRGARKWTADIGAMLTSEGDNRKQGNATVAKWFTLFGPDATGKGSSGVALLSHPHNGVQYTRLHPTMPYGCFLPVVKEGMELAPGKSYETNWRYVAYDGVPQPRVLDAMWRDWANPPASSWSAVVAEDTVDSKAPKLSTEQATLLKTFREEFIEITPGKGKFPAKFTLGDKTVADNPPREVTFEEPFAIAAYETTQNLYRAVMGVNPSRWKGERNSVEVVSRTDAEKFCAQATTMMRQAKLIDADQEIRLPSEDEWEYTARAGTRTAYSFGETAKKIDDYAWYTGNAAGNDPPVGAKKPNAWGLYDVHGYLWEWCANPHKEGEESGVIRSGSWKDAATLLRSSVRKEVAVDYKDDAVGFRCVLSKGG